MHGKRFTAIAVGVALVCSAPWSAALTLGKLRGTAWIGQPLDISVPLELDADQSAGDLCAEAEVFHGDTRQDSKQVRVTLDSANHPDKPLLRIRSASRVDEPVVSVNLRLGCTQKITRRLVMLADYPSANGNGNSNAAPTASATAPTPAPTPAPVPAPAVTNKSSSANTSVVATLTVNADSAAAPASATPAHKPTHKTAPRPALPMPNGDGIELTLAIDLSPQSSALLSRGKDKKHGHHADDSDTSKAQALHAAASTAAEKTETADKPHKARLQLDPVESLSDRIHSLETSQASAPADSASSLTSEARQLEALQSDLKGLIEQASKNEAAMAAMRARLEHNESNQGPTILAYSLLTLIALALLAVLLFWARQQLPRWRKKKADPELDVDLS